MFSLSIVLRLKIIPIFESKHNYFILVVMEKIIFLFMAILLSAGLYAQRGSYSIKGTVTDEQTGEAIPGANIGISGVKGVGTSTNFDGEFTLDSLSKGDTLIVSFVGYFTQKIPAITPNDGNLVISLEINEDMQKDVIVLSCFGSKPLKSRISKSAKHLAQNGRRYTSKFAPAPLIRLKGRVIDERTGETIPGANLTIKKTKKATSTNFDGLFSLDNLRLGDILVVEFVGYHSKKIPVSASNDSLIIRMKIDENMLYDIVEI